MILFFCLNEGKGKCQKVHSSLEASEEKQGLTFSENCSYKDIRKTWNLELKTEQMMFACHKKSTKAVDIKLIGFDFS